VLRGKFYVAEVAPSAPAETCMPFGTIQMFVDNPSAELQFTVGRKFYVDFTPAE
jgi:hypothetical protein